MEYTLSEVLRFVEDNDVKFIRLAFVDAFGALKNISIMPSELPRALRKGISFDASAVRGFLNVSHSDLFLMPDLSTLSILPWRPQQGRVVRLFCSIFYPDGAPFEGDARRALQEAVARVPREYEVKVGPECEFYLFENDQWGNPTEKPLDRGGYLDVFPLDKGENIRREICLTLEEMGISPESSHHEQGPGQNEVAIRCCDPLAAADQFITLKSVVRTLAASAGLTASFLPKPLLGESGSGLHINLSLLKNGRNLFDRTAGPSPEADAFLAGILAHIGEITLFLNPVANSYERLGRCSAPGYVGWSPGNRSQLVRIPAASEETCRMELRSPDPMMNPYLAFALLIRAGLDGMEKKSALPPPLALDLYRAREEERESLIPLPAHLGEAADAAAQSLWLKECLPEGLLETLMGAATEEYTDWALAGDKHKFTMDRYFGKA